MPALPLDEASNLSRIEDVLLPLARAARGRPVVLADGDRTLSPLDTSRLFLQQAGLDPLPIKQRFEREGYCFSAFRYHAEVHLGLNEVTFERLGAAVASTAPLHAGVPGFLRRAAEVASVFVISAGIPCIWRHVLAREGLEHIGVIGGIDPRRPYVFGRREKGWVCEFFQRHGSPVLALGDSDVDTDMMRAAAHAVVVLNHRRSADLLPHLTGHRSLHHIAPDGEPLPDLPRLTFDTAHLLLSPAPGAKEVACR